MEADITFPDSLDQTDRYILCDAVTSGGLLISVNPDQSEQLLAELRKAGVEASLIGKVTEEHPGRIVVEA